MDVVGRIRQLMDQRGWSAYRHCKESGLPQSTVAHIFSRKSEPTVSTLEILCEGFGITLGEFFADGDFVPLTAEQRELLNQWSALSEEQKQLLLGVMANMR